MLSKLLFVSSSVTAYQLLCFFKVVLLVNCSIMCWFNDQEELCVGLTPLQVLVQYHLGKVAEDPNSYDSCIFLLVLLDPVCEVLTVRCNFSILSLGAKILIISCFNQSHIARFPKLRWVCNLDRFLIYVEEGDTSWLDGLEHWYISPHCSHGLKHRLALQEVRQGTSWKRTQWQLEEVQ